MTTRRLVLLVLSGVGVLLTVVVLLALAVVRILPDADDAAANSQAAADRVAPGVVRVTSASWSGEAGGYAVYAELVSPPSVSQPSVSLAWHGDRRCRAGSSCESQVRSALVNVRDAGPERAALRRALDRCGLPVVGDPVVQHEVRYAPRTPVTVTGRVTVVVPPAALDGGGAARTADALDACVSGWVAERSGLTPVERHEAVVWLAGPDGRVHHTADVTVTDGRVTTTAASTLRPVR